MKKILFIILSLPFFLVFFASSPSFSQVYKWIDEKGVTHFTDDASQVPGKFQPKAETIETPQEQEDIKLEGEATPTKKDPPKDQLGRGEDYWKERVEEWRKKLREQQDRLGVLRARYNGLTERYNDSRSMAERASLRGERHQVKKEIDECNVQIDEAKAMMDKKIPEEAELYKAKPEWVKQ